MNKKFSECFETLINLFCVSDELQSYFAFECDGLKYILEKIGISKTKQSPVMKVEEKVLPEEELALSIEN